MSDYEITEKDIDGIIKYMQIFHPENANKEFAYEILTYLKDGFHKLALTDPDKLEELYDDFQKYKDDKTKTLVLDPVTKSSIKIKGILND